jgi:hypothetical protein
VVEQWQTRLNSERSSEESDRSATCPELLPALEIPIPGDTSHKVVAYVVSAIEYRKHARIDPQQG